MGGRGTDVAREASAIVLLDDDFVSIVKTIRLGRRIYDNLRKATGFIMAVHVPVAGLVLAPLAFGLPMLLGPVHIAFLEMIVDPVCTLVFEAEREEDDVMNRPPRDPEEPLASRRMIFWGLFQGSVVLATVGALFGFALRAGMAVDEVRALVFFALCVSLVALILVNRSFGRSWLAGLLRPNLALAGVLTLVAAILAMTLLWPFERNLFRFGPLHLSDFAAALGAGAFVFLALEGVKHALPLVGKAKTA
jgi:Ca2+-transporting ATPase